MDAQTPVLYPASILLPNTDVDLGRWAVLACDQFTSQPEYWQEVEEKVGDAPSTLRMILPEVYLGQGDAEARTEAIHTAMEQYKTEVLTRKVQGFVYIERHVADGIRQGLVGCVDLEDYSYKKGEHARIRPSEHTVEERIPPRLSVRRGAALESPHILMLCDDKNCTVIEPLADRKDRMEKLYSQQLMLAGGLVEGWAVTDEADIEAVQQALLRLEEAEDFRVRYKAGPNTEPFALAVGDGNHSLATAKAAWEELKPTLSEAEQQTHPARWCLVELENLQSPAHIIEPIHRVLLGVTREDMLQALQDYADQKGATLQDGPGEHTFRLLSGNEEERMSINGSPRTLCVGTIDDVLELLQQKYPHVEIDYVHERKAVEGLVHDNGEIGILLPRLQKEDLFRGVALGGVLPRKTFSMGHAVEKRYYLECRAIR